MKYVPFGIAAILMTSLVFCSSDKEEPKVVYDLPSQLKEVSGIEWVDSALWAIEDSGNENEMYRLDDTGAIAHTIRVNNATNVDWEDLASDQEGNLYIGDFGNNDNVRRDLCIYKVGKESLQDSEATALAKTTFSYPEQTEFPPKKTERFYDVEAFIVYQNHFYLFTKNRSKNSDGSVSLYKIPNQPGEQPATLLGKFRSCPDFNTCAITAAAISPDQHKVAILSHDKVWLFEDFANDKFYEGQKTELHLNHYSQKEAITFKSNSVLYIADERIKKSGGKVYEFVLAD